MDPWPHTFSGLVSSDDVYVIERGLIALKHEYLGFR